LVALTKDDLSIQYQDFRVEDSLRSFRHQQGLKNRGKMRLREDTQQGTRA
jgi:hypothetical protein